MSVGMGTRRWRVVLTIVVLAAVAAGAAAWWEFQSAERRKYVGLLLDRKAMTIAPGVHFLGRHDPGASYVIETSAGLVCIDAGLDADASQLLDQMAELKLDPKQITAILLTHSHGDHVLGARALRELSGAKVYAGAGDAAAIEAGTSRDAFFSTFPMDRYAIHGTPIDVQLQGAEVLEFGDTRIQVLGLPGHTPGSICYLATRRGETSLFTGDTVSSIIGDLGTYAARLAPRYGGYAPDYLATLQYLRSLPPPDVLCPGHPLARSIPNSPRLNVEQWHKLLDRGILEMETLVERYQRDGYDFLDGNPKPLLAGCYYLGDYQERALYAVQSRMRWFLIDAPGDEELAATLEERFRSLQLETPKIEAVLLTSADEDATGGLESIVQKHQCAVVVADAGRERVKRRCPDGTPLLSHDDLQAKGWLDVEVLPLRGQGSGPVAYLFKLEGKKVLAPGRFPLKMTDRSVRRLFSEWKAPGGDPKGFGQSLELLRNVAPDVWLPLEPLFGQNANLYDDDWQKSVTNNLRLFQQ